MTSPPESNLVDLLACLGLNSNSNPALGEPLVRTTLEVEHERAPRHDKAKPSLSETNTTRRGRDRSATRTAGIPHATKQQRSTKKAKGLAHGNALPRWEQYTLYVCTKKANALTYDTYERWMQRYEGGRKGRASRRKKLAAERAAATALAYEEGHVENWEDRPSPVVVGAAVAARNAAVSAEVAARQHSCFALPPAPPLASLPALLPPPVPPPRVLAMFFDLAQHVWRACPQQAPHTHTCHTATPSLRAAARRGVSDGDRRRRRRTAAMAVRRGLTGG